MSKLDSYETVKSIFIAVIAGVLLWSFTSVREDVHTMTESVSHLNAQIAVLVERVTMYNRKVDEHEQRLRQVELEMKKRGY
jgi:outer membrane murein-binding lipoprotein Lpp